MKRTLNQTIDKYPCYVENVGKVGQIKNPQSWKLNN